MPHFFFFPATVCVQAFNFSATTANNMPSTLIKKQKPRYKPVNGIKRGFLFHIKVIYFSVLVLGLLSFSRLNPFIKGASL